MKTDRTSGTIAKISGKTGETREKTAGTSAKIGESYATTDRPAPGQKNWRRIGAIYGRIIEICDMIAKTVATTARTYGAIWGAEDTEAASHGLGTTKPAEALTSAGSSDTKCHRKNVMSRIPHFQDSITSRSTPILLSRLYRS